MEKLTLFYNWDQTEEADSIPPRLVEGCQTPPQQNGHIHLPVETHPDDIACQKKSPSEKLTVVSHFGLIWPPSNPSAHLFLVVWAENDTLAGAETFVKQNKGGVLNLAMWDKVNN